MNKILIVIPYLFLTACSDDQQQTKQGQQTQAYQQYQQPQEQAYQQTPQQPIIINQQPQSSGAMDGLVGFMAGHVIGSLNNNSQPSHTYIERNYYERPESRRNTVTSMGNMVGGSSSNSSATTNTGTTARLPNTISKPVTPTQPLNKVEPIKRSFFSMPSRPSISSKSSSSFSTSKSSTSSFSRPSIRGK